MPDGMQIMSGGSPADLKKLMESLGGEMKIVSGDANITPPEGSGKPTEIRSFTFSSGDVPPDLAKLMSSGKMTIKGSGPPPDGKLAALVARGADRRHEAGRAASCAWALSALDAPDDDELLEMLRSFSDDVGRFIIESPSHVRWHLLATGAIRRSRGLAAWQSFYDQFRLYLVASQHPDGTFAETSAAPGPLEKALQGEAIRTALGTLLLSLQAERVPVLLARAENPLAPQTTSQGERIERVPSSPSAGPPMTPGKHVITDPAEAAKLLESLGEEGGLEGLIKKPPKPDDDNP